MYLPLFASKVSAGFPSPADDYVEKKLDLNEHLVKNPAATFFVRATGYSMIEAGIFENDILIVDRSLTATSGKIVIVVLEGQLTLKRLQNTNGKVFLMSGNKNLMPIEIKEESDLAIWGVVTNVIHSVY